MAGLIVTIDGPAASGKSTAARLLAEKLGASFLDTGAMYRAVTLAAMQEGVNLNSEEELLAVLQKSRFKFGIKEGKTTISIDGVNAAEQIRRPDVTANARYIAKAPKVREKLVEMQRNFAADHERIVTEGRDQGTVAFPDADVKFFLAADSVERARRRRAELLAGGSRESLGKIQKDIEERDKSDRDRDAGPLKPAADAIVVDTTDLNIDEVVEKLLNLVRKICLKKSQK
jgi:cytidylate kinase